jgi:Ca-activated chloride channel family protein
MPSTRRCHPTARPCAILRSGSVGQWHRHSCLCADPHHPKAFVSPHTPNNTTANLAKLTHYLILLALALLLLPVAGLCVPGQSRRQARPGGHGEPKLRVSVNLVLVDATVKDKRGQIIDGLTKDDFLISEDGKAQTIAHFSRYQLPLAVALVVDLSGSILPFLRPLRYATMTALRSLKPEDQVALFAFTDRVDRLVDLTRDKERVADQIAGFSAGGSTNINGALYDAANYLAATAPQTRRVIILVSDNVPTASTVSSERVLNAMYEADTALYGLKVPGENPWQARMSAKMNRGRMGDVAKMAQSTGGEIFDVQKEGSLYIAFEALINRLKTRYTLGYYPTSTARDGRFRTLAVSLMPRWGKPGRDYVVLAKHGYFAPK